MNGFRRYLGTLMTTLSITLAIAVLGFGATAAAGSLGAANESACANQIAQTCTTQIAQKSKSKPKRIKCPGPYHTIAPDGRCVWSCGEGTRPDPKNITTIGAECVCKRGLRQFRRDRFGRRVCRK